MLVGSVWFAARSTGRAEFTQFRAAQVDEGSWASWAWSRMRFYADAVDLVLAGTRREGRIVLRGYKAGQPQLELSITDSNRFGKNSNRFGYPRERQARIWRALIFIKLWYPPAAASCKPASRDFSTAQLRVKSRLHVIAEALRLLRLRRRSRNFRC